MHRVEVLTLVLPDPAGPTNIRPCLTTVVSYSWIHLVMYPDRQKVGNITDQH